MKTRLRQVTKSEKNTMTPSPTTATNLHLRSKSLNNKQNKENVNKNIAEKVTEHVVNKINIYQDENSNSRKDESNFPRMMPKSPKNLQQGKVGVGRGSDGLRSPAAAASGRRAQAQTSHATQTSILSPIKNAASQTLNKFVQVDALDIDATGLNRINLTSGDGIGKENIAQNQVQSFSQAQSHSQVQPPVPSDFKMELKSWKKKSESLEERLKQMTIEKEVLEEKADKYVGEILKRDEKIQTLTDQNAILLQQIDEQQETIDNLIQLAEEAADEIPDLDSTLTDDKDK